MMNDFDGKFMQDEDLKDLLRQWRVPETPAFVGQPCGGCLSTKYQPNGVRFSTLFPAG